MNQEGKIGGCNLTVSGDEAEIGWILHRDYWKKGYGTKIGKALLKLGFDELNLRIGYAGFGSDLSSLYYGGQIGYGIDEKHRGNGYAVRACKLLLPVAKAHGMTRLLITNNVTNNTSRRVCEKLGTRLLRVVRILEWHPMYTEGQRFTNIFEWTVE